ncbi:MAG: hypothetical protein GPJ00_01075 [Microcystis aeruginosa W13-18]|nr:hypothetical protein [Microcystis aeruginosa W13-18]NCR34955.1 hypothetical protein [Microcystis aeruginosa S11-05]NCR48434.1 hypothetical protein [Microcystis aeruginosa S11-01]
MNETKISDALRKKAEMWMRTEGAKILAQKKEVKVKTTIKKHFGDCEAQELQVGDRIKFGRYLNSKTWVVTEVRKEIYNSISPFADSLILACRDPRKKKICQFSIPAERRIIREITL